MKRLLVLSLALALILSVFSIPASAEDTGSNKLHFISRNIGSAIDSNNLTFQAIEEATGLDIEWELKPGENYAQLCQIIIASGDYPDAMEFHSLLYPNDLQMLADDGVILPVNDLVEQFGQNILPERPDYTWFTSTTDGLRYAIPCRVTEFMQNDYLAIRKDWLDQLGLAIPGNSEEYIAALQAFADNKDALVGADKPLIPMGAWSGTRNLLMSYFSSEQGFVRNWNDVDGHVVYYVNMPGYKASLETFRKMYQMGLVESEFPLMNRENFFEKFFANTYGSFLWYLDNSDPRLSAWMVQYLAAVPEADLESIYPFPDANGKSRIHAGTVGGPQVIVFDGAENPANAVKLMNYLISDEGVDLVQMGIKGKHWDEKDGQVEVFPLSAEQKVELGYKSYYLISMKGYLQPIRAYDPKVLRFGEGMKAASVPQIVVGATPTYIDKGSVLSDIINKYETELIVSTDVDFDATFDKYVAEWNSAGGQTWTGEMDALYQAGK
ncbi:MAG TPA: extracellular solute-binding protein [Clostridia bacterium]|nr:extracellular solute-binding protein [Clostridia bacterium]